MLRGTIPPREPFCMKVLPSTVHDFKSNAERKVFDLLRATDLGKNAFALHSLNLTQHEYKRWAEIDFIVVWEEGAFALEIKGGRVSCSDGIWGFTNRFGETFHKSEGPFEQAKSGHDALRKTIGIHPDCSAIRGLCWGWGVLFPDIEFDISSVSWSEQIIADQNDIRDKDDLGRYLRRLAKWWRSQGRGHSSLADVSTITALKQMLRPDFEKIPSIGSSIDYALDTIVRLTEEQITVLDSIEDNERILCTGGAGTGKSFLAVEAARREAASGSRPILLCRSPVFAAFLKSRVRNDRVTVTDFDSIRQVPDRLNVFDVLIVDEAQDFLNDASISAIDHLVAGGLESGRWRMFLDPNNQSGLHEPMDTRVLDHLRKIAAQHRLKRNCRNTRQIVLQTQLLTGADIGVAVIEGEGPPIEIIDVTDAAGTALALEERIVNWLDDGVRPGHITILSPQRLSASSAWMLSNRLKSQLVLVDAATASKWPPSRITFSTIRDFKGLENRCIAVIDLDKFEATQSDVAELYVAMTRAHAGLWLGVPREQRPILNRLISEHTTRMLTQGGRP